MRARRARLPFSFLARVTRTPDYPSPFPFLGPVTQATSHLNEAKKETSARRLLGNLRYKVSVT